MLENSRQVGAYLKRGLHELQDQYHCIEEIRGAGLYIGVEFSEDGDINRPDVDMATATINLLRRDQVLVGTVGKYGNVLKIRPPLCFTRDNADLFLYKLGKVLKELS